MAAAIYEKKLKIMKERLINVGVMIGYVVHDLRAPLARIQFSTDLLDEEPGLNADQRDYIKVINSAVTEMNEMIDSILDYSRIMVSGKKDCDLKKLLIETIDELKIPDKIKLALDIESNTILLMVNRLQIKRVFINLIKNAVAVMPEGGELIIRMKEGVTGISISICDTGPGIDPEDIDKMFLPLFSKQETGTGFGLAASRSIIEAHGGSLSVSSYKNVGSTFIVWLPFTEQ